MFRSGPELDGDSPTVNVSEVLKSIVERSYPRSGTRDYRQDPDSGNSRRRLRPGGQRRGEEAASQSSDERSPVDHSIT
jgi:hypothetical protein